MTQAVPIAVGGHAAVANERDHFCTRMHILRSQDTCTTLNCSCSLCPTGGGNVGPTMSGIFTISLAYGLVLVVWAAQSASRRVARVISHIVTVGVWRALPLVSNQVHFVSSPSSLVPHIGMPCGNLLRLSCGSPTTNHVLLQVLSTGCIALLKLVISVKSIPGFGPDMRSRDTRSIRSQRFIETPQEPSQAQPVTIGWGLLNLTVPAHGSLP